MEGFKKKFDMRHEEVNPTSYLGLQCEYLDLGQCKIHNEKHVKEAIGQLEKDLGIQLKKENVAVHPKYCLELEASRILADQEITDCQKHIGMLQWIQSSLRFDVFLDTLSLARHQFSAREGHLAAVIKAFGCLKKHPKRGVAIDSTEPTHANVMEVMKPDFGN